MLDKKNIILRNLDRSDLDFLYSIENDEKLWKYGSERKYFSKLELEEYILNSITDIDIDNQLRFILLSSIGNAVIHSFSIDEVGSLIGAVKEL